MSDSRLITVAIHTFDRANAVKNLLETEGVMVSLQNVNLSEPIVSPGVRLRIHEADLPLALRIIENAEIFSPPCREQPSSPPMLVPTDFTDYSLRATIIAFHIAKRLGSSITFLHSYIDPAQSGRIQLSDALSFDPLDTEERSRLEEQENRLMHTFADKIRQRIKKGAIPAVKFNTQVVEGVPEDSILEFAKAENPPLIVMGTRNAEKREKDQIGSVTAEVLDQCRVPAFTIPESFTVDQILNIRNVVLLSDLEQTDILVLDAFYRLFPETPFHVTVVNIPARRQNSDNGAKSIHAMLEYCRSHYPTYRFEARTIHIDTVTDDFNSLQSEQGIGLIVVPNKKRNIFMRLFNPGLAHKLLFQADIPMMVIPV